MRHVHACDIPVGIHVVVGWVRCAFLDDVNYLGHLTVEVVDRLVANGSMYIHFHTDAREIAYTVEVSSLVCYSRSVK